METLNARLQRLRSSDSIGPGPEERVGVASPRRHAARGDEAPLEGRALSDFHSLEERALTDPGAVAYGYPAEDARLRGEVRDRTAGEQAGPFIEDAGPGGEGTTARERFERCAEEIARSAEVGERTLVEHVADLLSAREHGAPDIGHERGFPFGDAGQKPRRESADTGVQQGTRALAPEARDDVPFGLKRRVSLGRSVFDGEQCRTPTTCGVCLPQPGKVELDRGIAVDDEEVFATEPGGGILQSSGGSQDRILPEELQLGEIHRAIAKVALDFVAEMMEIDARFAEALARKP